MADKDSIYYTEPGLNTNLRTSSSGKRKKLQFENLITGFSAALIAAPEENLEGELNSWLKKFVEFLKVDRCMVTEYLDDSQSMHVLMNYTVPEVDTLPVVYNYAPIEGVMDELRKGVIIRAEKIPDDLPQIFRGGLIEKDKIRSVVIVPFSIGDNVIGSMTFGCYRRKRRWSDNVVRRIKLIGEIIANAILRIRSHKSLLEIMENRKLLEETYSSVLKNSNLGFMIINLKDHSIVDVNDEYCRMSGYTRDELISKKTWEIDGSMDLDKVEREKDIAVGEGSVHLITSHRRKDGSLFDVEVSSSLFGRDDQVVYSFIRDITDLKHIQNDLEERLEFEKLASELSTTLINIAPGQINDELNKWLKKFVEFLSVDRGIINEHRYEDNSIHLLMNYTVPGIDIPLIQHNQVPEVAIRNEFLKGRSIIAEKIPDDLPEGLRDGLMEKEGVKSAIIVPIIGSNETIGNLIFLSYRKERKWPNEFVRRIKLMGEIVANAIIRERSYKKLLEETEHRKAVEERYISVLKKANVGFLLSNLDRNIIDVNDEYCRMSGYSRDELLSMKITDIRIPLDPQELARVAKEIENTGASHHEGCHKKKDGSFIELDISTAMLGENTFFSFMRDITELNQRKREQAERLRFEELVSEFSAELINIDPDKIKDEFKTWLKHFVEFLKVDRGMVIAYPAGDKNNSTVIYHTVPGVDVPIDAEHETPKDIIAELEKGEVIRAEKIPEDLPPMYRGGLFEKTNTKSAIIVPLLTGNRVFGSLTFISYREERKWPDELIQRIKLIGEIIGSAILRKNSHDTLLKEMEQRQMLEERYSSIIKTANVGFMLVDLNDNILDVNEAYCKMTGYSRDELIGMSVYQLDPSLEPVRLEEEKRAIFEIDSFHHDTFHRRKDGTTVNLSMSASLLRKEELVCCFIRDVTELNEARKELEDRLKFEELTTEFSAALINIILDDTNEELSPWLKRFVEFLQVDRGLINEYSFDDSIINVIADYTDPDVDVAEPERSHKIREAVMNELAKGKTIKAEKIPDDLPEIFDKGLMKELKTKSIVIVPLSAGNRVIGNLSFASYRKESKWPDELIKRIKLIGEIIANAILRKRSSDALIKEVKSRHQVEEKYTSIIKKASVGFTISDHNQNILDVNDEYCRMSGYSREELINMKISDLDYTESKEKVDDDIGLTLESGSFHHHTRHIRKDGSIFDVEVNSQYSESERFFFSFVRDVTELNEARKELEERLKFDELISQFSARLTNIRIDDIKTDLEAWLKRFAQLLDVDIFGIGEYEKDYKTFYFICRYSNPELDLEPSPFRNGPISSSYGLEKYLQKGELIKLDSPNDVLPDDIKKWELKIKADGTKSIIMIPLIAGELLLGNMIISCMRNEKIWTDDLIRRLKLMAEIFANSLMRDRIDSELDNYRKDLEKMVDERTAELQEAQRELVLSEKMATLGRLTATVSHELRNPLGTVRSSVFSVQKRIKDGDEKVMNALERAERNIRRCDLIIDELLNYSRIHDLNLEPVQIDAWLSEVVDETIPPTGISTTKDLNAGVTVEMDQERFRRCIVNILTNSYQSIEEKDAGEPGNVHVKTQYDDNRIIIVISDNGVGFEMENKNKLFEPLFSTKAFGVGLGIPITRQIIDQHGWEMDIAGEPTKGASVIITIPLVDK